MKSTKYCKGVISIDLSDILRVGVVDGVNADDGTIRVNIADYDDMVKEGIVVMSAEQHYPKIGESVLCAFLPNGSQGFCLGAYYNDANTPPVKDKDVYVKVIDDNIIIRYDYSEKKLTLSAPGGVSFDGDVTISGNLTVGGQIIN